MGMVETFRELANPGDRSRRGVVGMVVKGTDRNRGEDDVVPRLPGFADVLLKCIRNRPDRFRCRLFLGERLEEFRLA